MDKTATDLKCKNCNAPLKFNPKTQKWDCEYCGSSFTLEELNENKENSTYKNQADVSNVELDQYSCPTCGAVIITDRNTSATECVYCGSTAIMKNRLEGKFKPQKIIPFKTQKAEAVEAFTNFVKERWFSPDEFENPDNIEKVSGIYIPFWLFDGKVDADVLVTGKNYEHWSDRNFRYTRVNTYDCRRAGNMTFTDIPADGSSKFPDDIMDSIEPYDYKEFVPFDYSYLSGFLAEKYDLDYKSVLDRAKKRAENTAVDYILSTVSGFPERHIKNGTINFTNEQIEYALLPVWMLNIRHNDKMYTFAMNGQTGKMIGNIPIDKKKVLVRSLQIFSAIFLIGVIIALLFGGK